MSHTFKSVENGIYFHYSSDYSGNVEIVNVNSPFDSMSIPCSALFDFVADAIRNRKISLLEEMNTEEVLRSIINS